jgi:hypothetical protein
VIQLHYGESIGGRLRLSFAQKRAVLLHSQKSSAKAIARLLQAMKFIG